MKLFRSRSASAIALAAALSMTATPAMARGWGGGWGGGGRHHDDGISAGDVFAGILVIGGIAAIASAASKNKRDKQERDYRYPESRDDGRDYGRDDGDRSGDRYGDRYGSQGSSSRGIDGAVDSCVREVERGSSRVDTVDSVDRDSDGWRVEGRMSGGRSFACSVDRDGRIRNATVDGRGADASEVDVGEEFDSASS